MHVLVHVQLIVYLFTWTATAHLPVVVSRGAFITPLKGVNIYNDVELLHHIIGDLPDPPRSIATVCPPGATTKACKLSQHVHQILEDNTAILGVLNFARTTYGLSDDSLPPVVIQKTAFRPLRQPKVSNDPPTDEQVKAAGQSWYDDVKARLLDRKPFVNETGINTHTLSKRFVQYIKPILVGSAAFLGADDLYELVSNLFVGENGILKYLTTLQATSPELTLVDLSNRVSQFEATTRRLLADVVEEADEVKTITDNLQMDVAKHKMDIATIEGNYSPNLPLC